MQSKSINILFVAICLFLYASVSNAQSSDVDSLFSAQSKEISSLHSAADKMNSALIHQNGRISAAESELRGLQETVDSLSSMIVALSSQLADESANLDYSVKATRNEAAFHNEQINKKIGRLSLWWLICFLVIVCVLCSIYFFLKKRNMGSSSVMNTLSARQDKLEEDTIKIDKELLDILSTRVSLHQESAPSDTPDHSLALKVADEIVRIETNLSRMDSSVRGYKQLSASVRRIKDNFAANGYEFVDMLGKPYHEGMKVIANFVPDETLPENTQVITGIIKPQINYNGVMIQAAQITVSQNV